ncbi:oligosaccharide flippase family protein [Mucilaginibacter aquariorum]|uniref:Oligosaccharide flippase family protein n=1 Tax=Mucilaginibacter aquariorum TaxID=2967225 RepID=A0ABT1SVV4_9SPHI|nr:oligosaccharide flippase family protein [Mucilaginibacter aquariorum]MCQ6956330.1 oligosaccharide flippase family protein [Mucilaginibacter aquariorum]
MGFLNRSGLVNNSLWGLCSTVFQTLFLSLFFVIVSRHYVIKEFSDFLIANTVYQLIVGFSSMGLGHWFIREYARETEDTTALVYRFIKIQALLGIVFYLISIGFAFAVYQDEHIRVLSIVLGTNIIFDNIVYALKNLNIAQSEQKKSAIIMALDGLLRLIAGCVLFLYPISLIYLSILLVIVRLVTVNLFLYIGSGGAVKVTELFRFKITLPDFKSNVFANWRFILIVGSSIIFWRSATIIISKYLTATDVANYEVSYKIFSMFTIMAVVASTTVYPKFVKLVAGGDAVALQKFYQLVFLGYTIFAVTSFAFIQSFSATIIPFVFGHKFELASRCMQEMFLTLIVFPTVLLQANLIVAKNMEKVDMILNFIVLLVNVSGSLTGLYFYKSLSVINYSIFSAFVLFHILQSVVLVKLKVSTFKSSFLFYLTVSIFVVSYEYIGDKFNPVIVFLSFLLFVAFPLLFVLWKKIKDYLDLSLKVITKDNIHPVINL